MNSTTVLITGATGFVGRALASALRERGCRVVALVRRMDQPLRDLGVELVLGEIGPGLAIDPGSLPRIDACFHVAAKVGMWGDHREFLRVNLEGTRKLLELCKAAGVRHFIYTSSPSVIANGKNLRGVDESTPYPARFEASYPETKAAAERLVLGAHKPGAFNTVALRPHLIFGPGDTNLIPTIVEKGRSGLLKQIGEGRNLSDFTYIDDCVAAHLNALEALERDPAVGGRPYFISQGDPYPVWGFINRVLAAHGVPAITRRVPQRFAHFIAALLEAASRLGGGTKEPRLTRFLVTEMATDHYFSITAAKERLGFVPRYSVEEALAKTFGDSGRKQEAA